MKTCTILAATAMVGLSTTQGVSAQSLIAVDSMSYLLSTDYACGDLVQQCPKKSGGDASDEVFGFLAEFGGLNGVLECFQNNIEEVASRPTCGDELKSSYSMLYPNSETAYVGSLEDIEVSTMFVEAGSTTPSESGFEVPLIAGAGAVGFVGIAALVVFKKKKGGSSASAGSYKTEGAVVPETTEVEVLSKAEAVDML